MLFATFCSIIFFLSCKVAYVPKVLTTLSGQRQRPGLVGILTCLQVVQAGSTSLLAPFLQRGRVVLWVIDWRALLVLGKENKS